LNQGPFALSLADAAGDLLRSYSRNRKVRLALACQPSRTDFVAFSSRFQRPIVFTALASASRGTRPQLERGQDTRLNFEKAFALRLSPQGVHRSSRRTGGIKKRPVPVLETDQVPESVAVIELAADVLVDQFADDVRIEVAAGK
jgi:hypothetical protein